jgi:glycine/D-amino acid oxidase-like deaminating enzyme
VSATSADPTARALTIDSIGERAPAPDLLVVGAGVMGAWTALSAQRGGRRTALVDAFGAGHPRSTSGDETRISRSSHGTDDFYPRWSRSSRLAWLAAADAWGTRLFDQAGALWFARREDGFEAASLETLRRLGIQAERLSAVEVRRRWPQVGIADQEWALYEPEAGLLFARRGVIATVTALVHDGGSFAIGDVRPGRVDGRRLLDVADADGRRVAAGDFVFACGPWLPGLFPDVVGDRIRVTKQDVVYFGAPAGDPAYSSARLPCWVDFDGAAYGIPAVDERGPKAAADRYGPPFDPTSGDRLVDADAIRAVRDIVALRFPGLAEAPVVETRVCQYESTLDTHFVIDRHPDFDNVWLVGGGSGHGFKHGPAIGAYVTSLLDGAVPSADEARFALDRPREVGVGMRTGADWVKPTTVGPGSGVAR